MTTHLATLAQASVQQLRAVLGRVTALHADAAKPLPEHEFLAGVEAEELSWSDWEETSFDVREFHG